MVPKREGDLSKKRATQEGRPRFRVPSKNYATQPGTQIALALTGTNLARVARSVPHSLARYVLASKDHATT